MTRPSPTRYRTLNWPAYNAALRERGSLTLWFDPKMTWDAAPTGRRGGQQAYSDEAIQACLTIKVVFGLPLRQTAGFVASLLRLAGLDWTVPDYSTLCRRQRTLAVRLPYRGSKGPLHLLVDSTGIKVRGEGEWHARKHGGARRRVWRKVHLGIDEGEEDQERPRWGVCPTNMEVRAVEITSSHVGDAPVLPDLIGQIPADEQIGSVTADGAYDTRRCHDAIADRGAHAVIPPRRNARPWKPDTAGAMARNEAVRASKYLGRSLWRRLTGYHRRSRVETKMHCMKLLGQRLMARDFERQVTELQVRIAVLNRYTALGIPVTKLVG